MVLTEEEIREKVLGEARRVSDRLLEIMTEEETRLTASEILLGFTTSLQALIQTIIESGPTPAPVLLEELEDAAKAVSMSLCIVITRRAAEEKRYKIN